MLKFIQIKTLLIKICWKENKQARGRWGENICNIYLYEQRNKKNQNKQTKNGLNC